MKCFSSTSQNIKISGTITFTAYVYNENMFLSVWYEYVWWICTCMSETHCLDHGYCTNSPHCKPLVLGYQKKMVSDNNWHRHLSVRCIVGLLWKCLVHSLSISTRMSPYGPFHFISWQWVAMLSYNLWVLLHIGGHFCIICSSIENKIRITAIYISTISVWGRARLEIFLCSGWQ